MSTINSGVYSRVSLGSAGYPSPLTILPQGYVSYNSSAYLVTGTGTLVNQGTILQLGESAGAVSLTGASYVTNAGAITSNEGYAVVLGGTGGISNSGSGVISSFYGVKLAGAHDHVTNLGSIVASGGSGNAIDLGDGGTVTNGAPVSGASKALLQGAGGIFVGGSLAGTIFNYGTIAGQINGTEGISLAGGGTITNGAGGATLAQIQGYLDGIASTGIYGVQIGNSATITGTGEAAGSYGILIDGAGTVANIGTAALVQGNGGISIAHGSVGNAGTITSLDGGTAGATAVVFQGDGTVANTGATSLIEGNDGGVAIGGAGSVSNAGTILGYAAFTFDAVTIAGNGTVTNTGSTALIRGFGGVVIGGAGDVTNTGTIQGIVGGSYGVALGDGGSVTNGAATATSALIYGGIGVYVNQAAGTVTNYGTIRSSGGLGDGVELKAGGSMINGAAGDRSASVYGLTDGVVAGGTATVTNYGRIGSGGVGISLGGGTVIDSGTISGSTGAISFTNGGDLLVLRPGYAISGGVAAGGAGNTLELQGSATASVTANYTSLGLSGFQTIAFAPGAGANATLVIGNYAAFLGTIAGFTGPHDRIDLTNLLDHNLHATVTSGANSIGATLTVTADGGDTAVLQLGGSLYAGISWKAAYDGSGGTVVYAATTAPEITNLTLPYQGVPADTAATPFAGVTITDPGLGANDTVTVALSGPGAGTLSSSHGGSVTGGVFTVSGTPGYVTTALDSLEFTPSTSPAATVWFNATTLTVAVTGPDGSTGASAVVAETRQVLGLATATDVALSVNSVGGSFSAANGSDTNEAVVLTPTPGGTFSLPGGYQAEFLGGSSDVTLTDPSAGDAVLAGNAGADTISSGASGDTLVGAGAGSTMQFTGSASGGVAFATPDGVAMLDAGSHDTLVGSSGTTTASLTGANGLFFGQAGAATVSAGGTGNTIAGGSGGTTLQFTNSASLDVLFSGAAPISIADAGSGDTMLGSTGTTTAMLTGSGGLFFAEGSATTVQAGGQSNTIIGGAGDPVLQLIVGAKHDAAFGGTGAATLSDAGSNDTLLGSTASNIVTISGASALFFAEGSTDSVSASGQGDTLVGGSGQSTFRFSSGASSGVVFGGSGKLGISDAGSHDTMVGGNVSTNAAISGADALFFARAGATSVSAGGQGDTLVGGSGQSILQFGTGATNGLVFGGTAAVTVSDAGTGDTLVGSSQATAVTLAGKDAILIAGSGSVGAADSGQNDTIVAQGGPVAVTSGGSGLVVFGGSGSLAFMGGSHGATILAGSGDASVTGGSGGMTLFGAAGGAIDYSGSAGGLFYAAGSGDETLDASNSTTANVMFGGSGPDSIVGGQGAGQDNDTMAAGGGNDTLAGNVNTSSHDVFVFAATNDTGAPQDLVQNFTASDAVLLVGYGASAAGAALSSATTNDGSVTLKLSDNTLITFADVASVSSLTGHVVSS